MMLADHFAVLLQDTVNLSKAKITLLNERVEAIYGALDSDAVLGPFVQGKIPQGSWAHRTIIRPKPGREFDADFLLHLNENPEWSASPSQYIEQVYAALRGSSTYKDKLSRHCRCVRVAYANDCHVDIVPYLNLGSLRQVIVNKDEDIWEDTNPQGFTQWMRDKDEIANTNLRKVIRLLKFLRDRSTWTGTRSVILTTVVGERVESWKRIGDSGYYNSVPAALLHIVQDLDDWLQANPSKPSVSDPSRSGATFDHRWDEATYQHFRDRIHGYRESIDEAYYEPNKEISVALWQGLFGDGFKAAEPTDSSGRFGPVAGVPAVRSGRAG